MSACLFAEGLLTRKNEKKEFVVWTSAMGQNDPL
jgi:hypothetical protein